MKTLKISFTFIAFCIFIVPTGFANNNDSAKISSELQQEALKFLDLIMGGTPNQIITHLDDALKTEVDTPKISVMTTEIRKILGEIEKIELIKSQYYEEEGGIYSFIYNIETKGIKIEYSVNLKQTDTGVYVRGFNFRTIQSSSGSKTVITSLHILVGVLFAVCTIIQIWCAIYFARKKQLKRKWLYILLSFIGFPAGLGINWVTGDFIIHFGFKIPAVAISWPVNQPELWSMAVFFPIGLFFLIIEMNKSEKVPVAELSIDDDVKG